MKNNKINIVSPGRTCLFGDHQDYLGLPVIACAINRHISLEAVKNNTPFFKIWLPDIGEIREIRIDQIFKNLKKRDYLASSLRVLRRYDCIPDIGYDITISGNLAINAGISSSSALIVAWIRFLIAAYGINQEITPLLISGIAHEAEVLEHGEPGGIMDHYSIGIGNVLYINTGEKVSYEIIARQLDGLIVGESGVKKETVEVLGNLKAKAINSIFEIKQKKADFKIELADMNAYEKYSQYVSPASRPYFYAALKNHSITRAAISEFKKEKTNIEYIGSLMNDHHKILKEILKITVPRIDKMIDNAIDAGAYGAKIVGSGGGGSIIAIAPAHKREKVIEALLSAGARAAYSVAVDPGVRII